MPVDFSFDRWERIKSNCRRWWAGELDRPLILCTLRGRDPERAAPKLPRVDFMTAYDLSVPVEAIVDRWDYDLSCQKFLGDAFPKVWPNFGAGVVAAFIGARPEPRDDTVWFLPSEDKEIADIHFRYDPDNVYFNRLKDLCRAAVQRWDGLVQIDMTDLGGNLDILSTFRPGQKLLLDLYDRPDEVKRLLWEAHELWHRYYGELNEILQPTNPGYTAWAGIYSEEPTYMLQCDFCYMISPEMFDEFVRPELAASCKRLTNSFYHLDGPGQLPHLDSLLTIEELNGVQWVHGAGEPEKKDWLDVYEKILHAGKLAQIYGLDNIAKILDRFSTASICNQILVSAGGSIDDEERAITMLRKYGAA